MMQAEDWTIDELMCTCIARQVEDGDILAQGIATPLVASGYLLAWHAYVPNVLFASAIGQTICRNGAPLGMAQVEALWLEQAMVSVGFVQAAADLLPRIKPKEFFRPGQVDQAGNFNNIAFGKDYSKPRMRMPGTGGIPDVTVFMNDIYLYVPRHSRVTFVSKLDYLSGLGHHSSRRRGDGPQYLISDLGAFDFVGGRMRLLSIHPGVELERLKAKTGFELVIEEPVKITEPPTAEDVRLLREDIDPLGIRKLELVSGHKRRAALRTILLAEMNEQIPVEKVG
jgi:acyl CoA:acetate/3-ketoacid CoA transferase beta subunit